MLCAQECRCLWPDESIRHPGVIITSSCESPEMKAGSKCGCLQRQHEFPAMSSAPGEAGENKTMKALVSASGIG